LNFWQNSGQTKLAKDTYSFLTQTGGHVDMWRIFKMKYQYADIQTVKKRKGDSMIELVRGEKGTACFSASGVQL